MSLTTSIQDWLRDAGPREESATIARSHVAAETSADVDAICVTISPDVFFAVPVRTRRGQELADGTVLTDAGQVRGYYERRSGSYVVRNSAQLKSLATDWYVFNETAATLLGTGMVNGVDASGQEWVVNSAVIFPTAPDGIRGEICATRYPMDDVIRGATPPPRPAERDHGALLDRLSLALRDRDWEAASAAMADNHALAVRSDGRDGTPAVLTASDRAASAAALPALFGDAADLTILNRIASDWYVFAEYLMSLVDGGSRRLALLQPIEDGKVLGSFGYGREAPPA